MLCEGFFVKISLLTCLVEYDEGVGPREERGVGA